MLRSVLIGIAATGAAIAQDQTTAAPPPPDTVFMGGGLSDALPPPGEMAGRAMIRFVSGEMSFDLKPIAGAPYTAQTTTESIQTLADGNRIKHNSTALVARDSQGRTRREQTLDLLAFGGPTDPKKVVFIHDPVAQTSYVLHPDHTAQKMPFAGPVGRLADAEGAQVKMMTRVSAAPKNDSTIRTATESLGQQMMEGVQAEGKRVTLTIPAGLEGNEQPLHIVTETWYSPDLQTLVSSTRTDPRTGSTTFRLTGIQRMEPSPDLFQVPADYTVTEGPKGMRMEYQTIHTVK